MFVKLQNLLLEISALYFNSRHYSKYEYIGPSMHYWYTYSGWFLGMLSPF